MNPNLKSVYEATAGTRGRAEVHLQDARDLGNGYHKVVAAVSGMRTESDFGAALAALTDGAVALVPGSTVTRGRIVAGVVRGNARSKPMSDSMRMVSACTAADESGNIWRVVDDGSGKRVVLENADDMEAILRARIEKAAVVANPVEGKEVAHVPFRSADLIRYVDVDGGSGVHCAFAFDVEGQLKGVGLDGKARNVHPHAVMERVEAARLGQGPAQLQALIEEAGTQLSGPELEKAIGFLGRCGILSDDMAARMRKLSNTPTPSSVAA